MLWQPKEGPWIPEPLLTDYKGGGGGGGKIFKRQKNFHGIQVMAAETVPEPLIKRGGGGGG